VTLEGRASSTSSIIKWTPFYYGYVIAAVATLATSTSFVRIEKGLVEFYVVLMIASLVWATPGQSFGVSIFYDSYTTELDISRLLDDHINASAQY